MENKPKEKAKKQELKSPKKKTDKSLPSFPEDLKAIGSPGVESGTTTKEIIDTELEEICRDIIAIPFEVWAILKPEVTPLSEVEKKLIGKPLSRVLIKYDIGRFMKDEVLLLGFFGFSVLKRLRVKKNVADDSGKEGQGKNDISQKPDIAAEQK